MNHPLLLLLWLRLRGLVRHRLRATRNPVGLVFFLVGVVIIGSGLISMALPLLIGYRSPHSVISSDGRSGIDDFVPLALLVTVLAQVLFGTSEGIFFSPPEVDFLFAAPLRRSQLLAYRVAGSVFGSLINAVFFSMALRPLAHSWLAVWWGAATAVLFGSLFATLSNLARQRVGLWMRYGRLRWLAAPLVILVAAAIGIGIFQLVGEAIAIDDFPNQWRRLLDTPLMLALRAPFRIFSQTMIAPRLFPDLILWGGVAALADVLLFWLIVKLDFDFLEASVAASQRRQELLERARRGQMPVLPGRRWKFSMPEPPWWRGAGPVAWRHAITNLSGGLKFIVAAVIVAVGLVIFGRYGQGPNIAVAVGLATYSVPFVAARLHALFRQELEHIDWLKSLPIGAAASVMGQLLLPVAALILAHWAVLGGLGFSGTVEWSWIVATGLLLVPADLLLSSIEASFCLLFPTRATAMNVASVQSMGRQMVLVFLRMLLLAVASGLAAGVGSLAYLLSGKSIIVALVAAWPVLALESVAALWLAVWAWDRFDPSVDLPV